MSRWAVIRTVIGVVGMAYFSALLIVKLRPDQRPWGAVIVALLIGGCLFALYASWRRGRL